MSDNRFFRAEGPFSLGDLAGRIGAALSDPARAGQMAHDISDLEQARANDVALFSDARHAGAFAKSRAGAIVTNAKLAALAPRDGALLLCDDPRLAFALIGQIFYPRAKQGASIHSSAVIAPGAKIGARAQIGAHTVIGDGVMIGDDAVIGTNNSISHALIGNKVSIANNCSIGGEGFGFVPGPKGLVRLVQVGRVIIEDGVDIGSNCAIDRGAIADTVIGAGTAIDNLVQIGHNVRIGKGCVFAGQAGVAGSVTIGDFVQVGGAVSISDHLTIGDRARIAGKSGVARDVGPGETVAGYPAVPVRQWHRQNNALNKLAGHNSEKD